MGGFATGGGAEIEDAFARLGSEGNDGGEGDRFLDGVPTGHVGQGVAGVKVGLKLEGIGPPGDGLGVEAQTLELVEELGASGFEGIGPKADGEGGGGAGEKGGGIVDQGEVAIEEGPVSDAGIRIHNGFSTVAVSGVGSLH